MSDRVDGSQKKKFRKINSFFYFEQFNILIEEQKPGKFNTTVPHFVHHPSVISLSNDLRLFRLLNGLQVNN